MERLDLQRPPGGRFHTRANTRPYHRGYETLPHAVWGERDSGGGGGGTPGPNPGGGALTLTPNTAVFVNADTAATFTVAVAGGGLTASTKVFYQGPGMSTWDDISHLATPVDANSLSMEFYGNAPGAYQIYLDTAGTKTQAGTFTFTASELNDPHVVDPGNFTIAEIQAWVDAHPDWADELLANEQLRTSPRVTLVDWLEGFISHRDEGTIP